MMTLLAHAGHDHSEPTATTNNQLLSWPVAAILMAAVVTAAVVATLVYLNRKSVPAEKAEKK